MGELCYLRVCCWRRTSPVACPWRLQSSSCILYLLDVARDAHSLVSYFRSSGCQNIIVYLWWSFFTWFQLSQNWRFSALVCSVSLGWMFGVSMWKIYCYSIVTLVPNKYPIWDWCIDESGSCEWCGILIRPNKYLEVYLYEFNIKVIISRFPILFPPVSISSPVFLVVSSVPFEKVLVATLGTKRHIMMHWQIIVFFKRFIHTLIFCSHIIRGFKNVNVVETMKVKNCQTVRTLFSGSITHIQRCNGWTRLQRAKCSVTHCFIE